MNYYVNIITKPIINIKSTECKSKLFLKDRLGSRAFWGENIFFWWSFQPVCFQSLSNLTAITSLHQCNQQTKLSWRTCLTYNSAITRAATFHRRLFHFSIWRLWTYSSTIKMRKEYHSGALSKTVWTFSCRNPLYWLGIVA